MPVTVTFGSFEWDKEKAALNVKRHGITFYTAVLVFLDPKRILAVDKLHSETEPRHFCIGKAGNEIATVRFTLLGKRIRINGAGYYRLARSSVG